VLEAKQPRPDVLGRFRFDLAQARWSEAGDRPQALALAAAARAELSTLPESPVRTRRLAAIDGWVAARSPGAPAKSSR
jgi:hypothetical protein